MIRTSYFGATSKAVSQSLRTATATTAATARHGNNTGGPMAYNAIVFMVMVEPIRLSLIVRLDIGDSAKQSTGGSGGGGLTEKWYRFPGTIFAGMETPGANTFMQTMLLA